MKRTSSGCALVEHAEDHGVDANRLTGTGGTGHQQMRHFRQIGYYRIASDVFTQHHGERRWVITELGVVEHFTQVDGLAFLFGSSSPTYGLPGITSTTRTATVDSDRAGPVTG